MLLYMQTSMYLSLYISAYLSKSYYSDSQPPMEILDDIVQLSPNALSIPNETEKLLPLHCSSAAPNTSAGHSLLSMYRTRYQLSNINDIIH